jgi:CRP/FNR family cyclic AMP-dependent transcriptional regulator
VLPFLGLGERIRMDFSERLRRAEFVNGIPSLLTQAQSRTYLPGGLLFSEGDRKFDFHLILEGHVRLEMSVPIRGRIPLLTVGAGDLLAWSALLAQGRMTTSAIALDNVWTAAFDGPQLQQLCEQQPQIGYHVMKQLASSLSRRLLATRLQLLDLFEEHEPVPDFRSASSVPVDPEC